jgi:beta-carotene 3-hydroxylase
MAYMWSGSVFVGTLLATCAAMEAFAHWVHKHVMHGPLWWLHRSHHLPRHAGFQQNDWFALVFGVPSVILIYFGCHGQPVLLPVGAGMASYGAANWAFHDVLVHRRIRHSWVPRRGYLGRIVLAHHVHHRTRSKDGAESFGFFCAGDYRRRARRPGT